MEIFYKEEYQYPIDVLLNLTDDCNLACRYCFVEQHPHFMTFDIAKNIADWLYKNYLKRKEFNFPIPPDDKIQIYFFGGEPTLCYDSIIVPLVNYCNSKYPDIFKYGITTNGTLLNKEKIDFFKKNNFFILLSIDGNEETQNFNRPCKNNQRSFDLLTKNIPYLLEQFPQALFRSTIYAPTVNHLYENYLYIKSLGVRNYVAIPDIRHEELWTQERIEIFREQVGKIYTYQLNQLLNNNSDKIEDGYILSWIFSLFNYLKNEQNDNLSFKRCGLGTQNCAIGWDGKIYACQEQPSKEKKNIFYIGDLATGIDKQKHIELLQIYSNGFLQNLKNQDNNECANCYLKEHCKTNPIKCPSTIYDLYSDLAIYNKIDCEIKKIYMENSILFLSILSNCKTPEELAELLNNKKERE